MEINLGRGIFKKKLIHCLSVGSGLYIKMIYDLKDPLYKQ